MPTILVVDDTEAVRGALIKLLEREGYDTRSASNGREALESLEADAGHPPDLVLLDIAMPEVDGLDVLESITRDARWRAMPVIMLTGEHDYHCVRRAEQLGAKHYLVKATFSVGEMLHHIGRYTKPVCN